MKHPGTIKKLIKLNGQKVLAIFLAVICTAVGGASMLVINDRRIEAAEAAAEAEAEALAKAQAGEVTLSVPSSGMSVVLNDYAASSGDSAVDYLTATAVAEGIDADEYINAAGSFEGKYIVCTAETYASVYSETFDIEEQEAEEETDASGDGESDSSNEIARIYTNGLAVLVSADGDWCYIFSGDISGYVKTSDFAFGEDARALEESTYITTVVTEEDDVYLYELANTKSTVECILDEGMEFEYISDTGYGFYEIYVDGVGEGYVLSSQTSILTSCRYAVSMEDVTSKTAKIAEGVAEASGLDPSFIWPLPSSYGKSRITSKFGYRNGRMHYGIDIYCPTGTKIYAVMDGTVVANYYEASAGNAIVIYHGDGLYTVYFHMKNRSELAVGTKVSQGDVIGYVGSTGNSTGSHLHFAVGIGGYKSANFVDPSSYLGI